MLLNELPISSAPSAAAATDSNVAPLRDGRKVVLSISPIGNLGNRMLQYMALVGFGRLLADHISINCDLPEWGFHFDAELHRQLSAPDSGSLVVHDREALAPLEIIGRFNSSNANALVFQGLFQRVDLHYSASFYRDEIFRYAGDCDDLDFGDDELVINVRAGEIVGGVPWYPLVPVEFYRTLVAETGKAPVFLGQLDDSAYVSDIRRAFPGARMIPSGGPMVDLARLRRARHLCLAVSTFSWVAGFLSDAVTVHYPLLGFMHPRCFVPGMHDLGGIDLLPADDPRFCFHLFPALRGDCYDRYAAHVGRFSPISRRISRRHAALLKGVTPFVARDERRYAVDASWYLRTYPDAAWDIAEGWYADALHHYTAVGRGQGYAPHEPLYRPICPDIARGKFATQSSRSPWSLGQTIEADAARVVDGDPGKEFGCHTAFEDEPWWMIDLGALAEIECVTIYNRHSWDFVRARTVPFTLEFSVDGSAWESVGGALEPFDFGAEKPPSVPWQWVGLSELAARYVRVRLPKSYEALHLTAVEVNGSFLDDRAMTCSEL